MYLHLLTSNFCDVDLMRTVIAEIISMSIATNQEQTEAGLTKKRAIKIERTEEASIVHNFYFSKQRGGLHSCYLSCLMNTHLFNLKNITA